jgi:DnaK suppressor protein
MNKKELEKFKKLLLKIREKMSGELKYITDDTLSRSQRDAAGDLSGYTYHMADVATDTYDREFSLNIASNEQKILFEIDEALKRIEDKSYGNCVRCNKKISKSRLTAVPYARFCISCQTKEERR